MNNLRMMLREELVLNDRKSLLSEQSLILINDYNHINYVLGIRLPVNEHYSYELRKQIIEEQLMLEDLLTSINKFLGSAIDKGKEKVITIVNSVKTVKDIAVLFKDLLLSPNFMDTAVKSIKKVCNEISTRLKTKIEKVSEVLKGVNVGFSVNFNVLITYALGLLQKLSTGTGWKGFLSMLGFCTLMVLVETKMIDVIIDIGVKFIDKYTNAVEILKSLFDSYQDFIGKIMAQLNIDAILGWFTKTIEAKANVFFAVSDVLNIIGDILEPVLKSINWNKKLMK